MMIFLVLLTRMTISRILQKLVLLTVGISHVYDQHQIISVHDIMYTKSYLKHYKSHKTVVFSDTKVISYSEYQFFICF